MHKHCISWTMRECKKYTRFLESLRLRFVKEGLAMWLVLFVLPRIDWGKGIGQVLESVVGDVQVGTSGTVSIGESRR